MRIDSVRPLPRNCEGERFTEIRSGEFRSPVHAGDRLLCQATFDEDGYFRKSKILTRVEMQFDGGPKDGETVFTGFISGMWVPKE